MALPSFCPRTGTGPCTGAECTMHIIDWRSKEEYCMIGYYPVGSRKSLGEPVMDTYASSKRGKNAPLTSGFDWNSKFDELPEVEDTGSGSEQRSEKLNKRAHKSKDVKDVFTNLKQIPEDYEEQFWSKL